MIQDFALDGAVMEVGSNWATSLTYQRDGQSISWVLLFEQDYLNVVFGA